MKLHHHIRTAPYIISGILALIIGAGTVVAFHNQLSAPVSRSDNVEIAQQPDDTPATTPQAIPEPIEPEFDKTTHSSTDPSSIWVVVNKQHALNPINFTPTDLVAGPQGSLLSARANPDLNLMLHDALTAGVTLTISSSYRSYANQTTLYNNYVARYGQVAADTISAKPGYSEHQTGLAVDVGGITQPACNFNECFGESAEGQWLKAHAATYGFLIRYTADNSAITGYNAEPWHLRYVGKELTAELKKQKITTLEEFFDISGGTTYAFD